MKDQATENKAFIKRHFEATSRRDVSTIIGNMLPDLYDHELHGDHKNDLREGGQRFKELLDRIPDLNVELRDIVADEDKVIVRAIWSGTDRDSHKQVEFHGFVQFRIQGGKIAERWATVTPMAEMTEDLRSW